MKCPHLSWAAAALAIAALAFPSPVTAGELTYTVKEGQSLSMICREAYGDQELFYLVALYNGKENPEKILPGEDIRLPFSDKVILKKGESLSGLSKRMWKDPKKYLLIAWANSIRDPARVPAGARLVIPVLIPYRLQRGGSVSSTAQQLYGDPKMYAPILIASGIEDPARVPAGALLMVPYLFPRPDTRSLAGVPEKKARAAESDKAMALLRQAEEVFRTGSYGDAWNLGHEASKGLDGLEKARALRLLAACQYAFRRMDEALADLKAAHELDPGFRPDPAFVNPEMMALYEKAREGQ